MVSLDFSFSGIWLCFQSLFLCFFLHFDRVLYYAHIFYVKLRLFKHLYFIIRQWHIANLIWFVILIKYTARLLLLFCAPSFLLFIHFTFDWSDLRETLSCIEIAQRRTTFQRMRSALIRIELRRWAIAIKLWLC